MPAYPAGRAGGDGRAVARRPTATPRRPATGRPMADMYTEDATYGWNSGPTSEFMAVGRDEIRDIALGAGDGRPRRVGVPVRGDPHRRAARARSSASGARSPTPRGPTARRYEVAGIGGSWFRYAGDFQWRWQRDWFDFGNAAALFMEMMTRRHAVRGHDRAHGALDEEPTCPATTRSAQAPVGPVGAPVVTRLRRRGPRRPARSTASSAPPPAARTFETLNPATEEVLGVAADGTAADMDAAIAAARRAFDETRLGHRRRRCACAASASSATRCRPTATSCAPSPSPRSARRLPHDRRPARRAGRDLGWVADLAESYEWQTDLGEAEPMGDAQPPLGAPRAGRRRRRDHAVELPAPAQPGQGRARRSPPAARWCSSRHRTRRGARVGAGPHRRRARPTSRRACSTSSTRRTTRSGRSSAPTRGSTWSRSPARRPPASKVMAAARRDAQAGVPRAGRQVRVHRARRRRHAPRPRPSAALRRLHPRRPGLRHHHPPAGAPRPVRRGRRGGRRRPWRRSAPATRPTPARSAARSSRPASASASRATSGRRRGRGRHVRLRRRSPGRP